ncbi:putative ankyrin repeat protein RF_0381 [Microplitis mediator]|uniref:putative ankyrin repeat protein RF_0381 n=1 Tax=Microplitis mediator TaxID=375433 RepID=UPI00255658A0|nr:putative ankyrin repeat protein RF_0381 [Microplitis mediator]
MEIISLRLHNNKYVNDLIDQEDVEDINAVYPVMGGFTLLHIAAFINHQRLVVDLLRQKADVNLKSRYWGTALHIAIIMENLVIIESLINYGADVNTQLIADSGLIHFRYGDWQNDEEVPEFLSKGENVVSKMLKTYDFCFGKSPLQIAVDRGNEKMVELLLENNADPNLNTYNFETPLVCAINKGNLSIIKLLLAYGADVNSVTGYSEESALHIAVHSGNREAVELILNHSMVDVNIVTVFNQSALHYAFIAPDDNIIRQLLDAGVDINIKNKKCQTAFASRLIYSQKVKDTIAEHIAKLSAADFNVGKQNLAVVDISSEKFCELRDRCLSEIGEMKKTFIGTSNVTFYNVLCNKCEHKLALSLKHVSDSTILNFNIQSLFPLYGGMITYRLRKALGRKKLLSNAISLTDDIFDAVQLPNTFTRGILKLLTNRDLEKLQ